ncbi:MAG TPA: hypothetical protein VES73_11395 [Lamprocystis sp. (in: g-proteobacteria)]|nr:hypothetical protein [Lamprocystis sp. (in: g-proteobacteria)]
MLEAFIEDLCQRRLKTYGTMPEDIGDHCKTEELVLGGGYEYRQIVELV